MFSGWSLIVQPSSQPDWDEQALGAAAAAAVEFGKHLLDASSSLFAQGHKVFIQDIGFQVKDCCFHGMQCYVLCDLMERKAHETRSTPS